MSGNLQLTVFCTILTISSVLCSISPGRQCTWLYQENPNDCHSYFQCLNGISILKQCPDNLQWNQDGMYCDWAFRTECKSGSGGKIKKNQSKPNAIIGTRGNFLMDKTQPKAIIGNSVMDTDEMESRLKTNNCDYLFSPHPSDCTKYTMCAHGQISHYDCPGGLHWNTQISSCDWPAQANCKPGSSSSSSTSAISSSSSSTSSQPQTPSQFPSAPEPPPPQSPPPAQKPPSSSAPVGIQVFPSATMGTTTTMPTTTTTSKPSQVNPQQSGTTYPILLGPPPSGYKVVCYFAAWANYRQGIGKYTPENIDPSKCTHIIYAFAQFNDKTFKLEMTDTWVDSKEGLNFYGKVTSLRAKGIKVSIAIGGWSDSGHPKWSYMLRDPYKMGVFIESCHQFITEHGFDGVDLDYEYPGCPNANCNFDSSVEKQGFVALVRGLRQRLGENALVTAAVSCSEVIMNEAYDIPSLSKYLSFFNVMSYDIHGSWEKITGHNAPLDRWPTDEQHLNVRYAIKRYLELSAPPEKIVMGIPFYGQNYLLASDKETGIGARAAGPGPAGPYTKQSGVLAYYEICARKGMSTVYDSQDRMGPYSYGNKEWVSYDDPIIIRKKVEVIKEMRLGGAMIWSLDFDDFRGECGEKYPLLGAINTALRSNTKVVLGERSKNRRKGSKLRSRS